MIIYNLSQLKISLLDSRDIDIETYIDILEIQAQVINKPSEEPSQFEIDLLFS
jgi:hypothetical protein